MNKMREQFMDTTLSKVLIHFLWSLNIKFPREPITHRAWERRDSIVFIVQRKILSENCQKRAPCADERPLRRDSITSTLTNGKTPKLCCTIIAESQWLRVLCSLIAKFLVFFLVTVTMISMVCICVHLRCSCLPHVSCLQVKVSCKNEWKFGRIRKCCWNTRRRREFLVLFGFGCAF